MNYKEFKRHVAKAGLTIKMFATLLHLSPSTITNYSKKNEVPMHLAIIAVLMGEMADKKLDFIKRIEELDFKPQIKRPNAFKKSIKIKKD
ncbi:MAG: XRE family transcriptional regulator [Candidatus Izemoplasmatales bacterium]